MANYVITRATNSIIINTYIDDQPGQYKVEVDTLNNRCLITTEGYRWEIDCASDNITVNGTPFAGTAAALKTLLYSTVFADLGGGGSSSYLVKTEANLTDDQIKALPSAGVDIITAPGNNKIISIINAVLSWNVSGGAYTNVDASANIVLTYGDFDLTASSNSNMVTDNSNRITILSQAVIDDTRPAWFGYSISFFDGVLSSFNINKKIMIWGTNGVAGNYTGGNAANSLKITVYYIIVDV